MNEYIDEYIRDADEFDKMVAHHLKEIIPQTTHLDEKVLNAIIEELMKEMGNGKGFKEAFHKKRKRFILTGDRIDAELPSSFIRFVLNVREFLEYISNIMGVEVDEVESIIKSRGIRSFIHYIGHLSLASIENDVVFATFDEDHPGNDPFTDYNVSDIINMLAMDRNRFKSGEPLSVVKIIYRNKKDIEKKFPIFFDAGWYDKFYPTERKDKYGRTRSLDPNLKNMPEIVHRNIKISEVTEDIQFFED